MNFECLLCFIIIFKQKALKISKKIRRYTKSIGETAMKRHYMRRSNSRREFQMVFSSLVLSCFSVSFVFFFTFFFISLSVVAAYISYLPLSFLSLCLLCVIAIGIFLSFLFYFLFVTKKLCFLTNYSWHDICGRIFEQITIMNINFTFTYDKRITDKGRSPQICTAHKK